MMKKTTDNLIRQSIIEYQPLFLHRPEDKAQWKNKRKEGILHCYITENGELILWKNEKILKTYNDVTLNMKDDSFNSRFKKMRVAKHAPRHWRLFFTTERIVATIPYGKTLKIGDFAELIKTPIKRHFHKNHYISVHLPHSMLAGIVLRLNERKTCDHIAFIYKNKLVSKTALNTKKLSFQKRIVNYTLFFFDFGYQKQAEKFSLKLKNLAGNLQLNLLTLVKQNSLLSNSEILNIKSEISQNLNQRKFKTDLIKDGSIIKKNISIKTLFVGGIPLPIFPRENCNFQVLPKSLVNLQNQSKI